MLRKDLLIQDNLQVVMKQRNLLIKNQFILSHLIRLDQEVEQLYIILHLVHTILLLPLLNKVVQVKKRLVVRTLVMFRMLLGLIQLHQPIIQTIK